MSKTSPNLPADNNLKGKHHVSQANREIYAECDRVRFSGSLVEASAALASCIRDAASIDYETDPVVRGQIERCAVDVATRLLAMPAANPDEFHQKYSMLLAAPYPPEHILLHQLAVIGLKLESRVLGIEVTVEVSHDPVH